MSGPDQLDGFYDVLSENMTRKGTPMYGRPFFHSLLRQMGARATVLTLHHQGRAVSGAVLIDFKGVLYVPFASSRPSVFTLRANYLLYWEILRHARATGCRALDLGSSLKDSPGLVFKKKWGSRMEPVLSGLYARDESAPVIEPGDSAMVRLVVKAWARAPRAFTERFGPMVTKWTA